MRCFLQISIPSLQIDDEGSPRADDGHGLEGKYSYIHKYILVLRLLKIGPYTLKSDNQLKQGFNVLLDSRLKSQRGRGSLDLLQSESPH
jgi:hypothetical protein